MDIHVDPWITAMQVKELQNRVKKYMREDSKDDWLQPADPYIIAMDVRVRRDDAQAQVVSLPLTQYFCATRGACGDVWAARGRKACVEGVWVHVGGVERSVGRAHREVRPDAGVHTSAERHGCIPRAAADTAVGLTRAAGACRGRPQRHCC